VLYHICHNVVGTTPLEQKQPYDKYDIAQNTGTIPVEQKQPYDKYDISHNTGTILLYHIFHKVISVLQEWFLYYVLYHICPNVVSVLQEWFLYYVLYHMKQPYDKYDIT
jgi:hypothetical protein